MSIIKLSIYNTQGQIIQDNDICKIIENEILTKVTLYRDKKTIHNHIDTCLFYFIDGFGALEYDSDIIKIKSGDMIFIENEKKSMKIINIGDANLHYIIVKDKDIS